MTRYSASAAAILLAALCGCTTMCQTPFDYCNAVIGPEGCPNCNFGARYGSRFAPMYGTPPTTPLQPTPAGAAPATPEADEEPLPSPSEEPPIDDFFSGGNSSGATADEIASFLESRTSASPPRQVRSGGRMPRTLR